MYIYGGGRTYLDRLDSGVELCRRDRLILNLDPGFRFFLQILFECGDVSRDGRLRLRHKLDRAADDLRIGKDNIVEKIMLSQRILNDQQIVYVRDKIKN